MRLSLKPLRRGSSCEINGLCFLFSPPANFHFPPFYFVNREGVVSNGWLSYLRLPCPGREGWEPVLCQSVPLSPKCTPPRCPLRPHSPRCLVYGTDPWGCPTCACECDEMSQICPVNCPSGTQMVTKSNECKECRCRPFKLCRRLQCENQCPFGRSQDLDGCPICACRTRRQFCSPVLCPQVCPYGTFTDTDDCPTCMCKPKPVCSILACDNFCANGREQDSNGCDVSCQCNPIRSVQAHACSQLTCAGSIRCTNGAELDSNGCPTCRCKLRSVGGNVQILDLILS